MAVSAVVENGQIVQTTSQTSLSDTSSSSSSVDKEDFLQLLVAQMQYQDPLEPTDNTEWVTQYAQFSQVEELQTMSSSMELSRASSLVGQTVIMDVEGSDGSTTEVQGNVDYVKYESGNAYLSINGSLYSMDDLKLVVDDDYMSAVKSYSAFTDAMDSLPDLTVLTADDEEAVANASSLYGNLNEQALAMVDDSYKTKLSKYVSAMKSLTEEV